jgi:hypothetical protein
MATATGQSPLKRTIIQRVPAVAAGSDADTALMIADYDGTLVSCSYVPDTVLTGVVTNSRTLALRNKGATGVGSTVMATQAFVNGVNIAAMDEGAIPVSGTPANLDFVAGDVIALQSLHVGTGLADPGGLLRIVTTRA